MEIYNDPMLTCLSLRLLRDFIDFLKYFFTNYRAMGKILSLSGNLDRNNRNSSNKYKKRVALITKMKYSSKNIS